MASDALCSMCLCVPGFVSGLFCYAVLCLFLDLNNLPAQVKAIIVTKAPTNKFVASLYHHVAASGKPN